MLSLPILNVHLAACSQDWQQMTPTAQGRHCASCNREVVDFTSSTQADLDAARAASPDGRLCGRFRAEQLAAHQPVSRVRLRPKLRRFVVALVLVCGLGLSGRQAWAQARQLSFDTELQLKTPAELSPVALVEGTEPLLAPVGDLPEAPTWVGMYVEQMPTFPGGYDAFLAYVKRNAHYPAGTTAAGKVFVSFLVTSTGAIREPKIMKGINALLDAEALRLVQQMPAWTPGQQNGRPVDVAYTMPITFSREADAPPMKRKGRGTGR